MMGIWGLMTTSLLIFLAEPIFSIFIREPDVLGAGVEYLRILGLSQFFMLIELTSIGAFAGLGKTSIPISPEHNPDFGQDTACNCIFLDGTWAERNLVGAYRIQCG